MGQTFVVEIGGQPKQQPINAPLGAGIPDHIEGDPWQKQSREHSDLFLCCFVFDVEGLDLLCQDDAVVLLLLLVFGSYLRSLSRDKGILLLGRLLLQKG